MAAAANLSPLAQAIRTLYGIAIDINSFLDKHIEEMKNSDNATISRTGRVLEMAKYGFGIGYITSVVIIAAGQLLLGNPLMTITTVATAATLTNPIAMTCAAFGALYYGWGALSDVERDEILEKLTKGLHVGIELIKSIVRFVVDKANDLLNARNFDEIKKFVTSGAALFGKTLGDVTYKVSDVVSGALDVFKRKSGQAIDQTFQAASNVYGAVATTTGKAGEHVSSLKDKIGEAVIQSRDVASEALQTVSSTISETAASIETTVTETGAKIRNGVPKKDKEG